MNNRLENLIIEDAKIAFRNFSGRQTQYNREGDRNFVVLFDDAETVERLQADGWNVAPLKQRDEDDPPRWRMAVKVKFDDDPNSRRNPKIYLHTRRNVTALDEESVSSLDYADILACDLVVRPYQWEVNGKTGVSAYLKTLHVTIEEDEFAEKYTRGSDDIPF